jgi:hypothetical protein
MKEVQSSSETSVLTEPHGVTSQKTPFFIFTAVKFSNLIYVQLFTENTPLLFQNIHYHADSRYFLVLESSRKEGIYITP